MQPSPQPTMSIATVGSRQVHGGRFDFDDGGTYCGGWEDGKAHGHGVCTGPKGQGEYAGSWHYGFEVSGIYTWPSGSTYEGQWQNGKRHGIGVELRGRWLYRGEWTAGLKGRYGVRQSTSSNAKYEGTWANGLQDGYGTETYADAGTFQGQWLRGLRHGYGVRVSAPFGVASNQRGKNFRGSQVSLRSETMDPAAERDRRLDDGRGGFVLKARSDEVPARRRSLVEHTSSIKKSIVQGLKLRKQHSTGELEKRGTGVNNMRSTASSASWVSTDSGQSAVTAASHHTDSNASFVVEDDQLDASVTETYMGEWKNDKRAGFGISERSDGLKYEGEWFNNKKYGYGVTIFKDGSREEGKYKNNVLITSQKKKHLFLIRSAKFRERVDAAVSAAQRASKIALQKADIAASRTATSRGKAEQADIAAMHAREDADMARLIAKQLAPDFDQPGMDRGSQAVRNALANLVKPNAAALSSNDSNAIPSDTISGYPNNIGNGPERMKMDEAILNTQNQPSGIQRRPSVAVGGVRAPMMPQPHLQRSDSAYDTQSPSTPYSPQESFGRNMSFNNNRQNKQNFGMGDPYSKQFQQDMYRSNAYQSNSMNYTQGGFGNPNQKYPDPQYDIDFNRANQMPYNQTSQPSFNHFNEPAQVFYDQGQSYRRPRFNQQPDYSQQYEQNSAYGGDDILDNASTYSYSGQSNPVAGFQSTMDDRFDHYKRPPSRERSRDPSVDRFSRSSHMGSLARDRSPSVGQGGGHPARSLSRQRGMTPTMQPSAPLRSETPTGRPGSAAGFNNRRLIPQSSREWSNTNGNIPSIESLSQVYDMNDPDLSVRRRNPPLEPMGQEIPVLGSTPKRTESLFVNPAKPAPAKAAPVVNLQRKKSLPDPAAAATAATKTPLLSREEASVLSSQRREEMRRQQTESERYRANPLLYLTSPAVRDWFARQRLTLMILLVNISLAYIFFKLLT
ncbi:junctophilin-1-like isoform X2 [Artemia franciscana]|uniref:junctophilin-1-like isoform X2 n=1 Tax=Artemia franciscana TaxID=6661 RepID=UPI0032DB1034